jgi:succinate-semialdehyde dehydrogenase/glutarate-semialdehyde dehydrogenase
MIHERQLRIVEAHVEDAVARGARVLAGGSRLPELGRISISRRCWLM